MRLTRYAAPLALVLVAACGGAAPDLPDDSTFSIDTPDTTDASSQGLSNCPNGDDAFSADAKKEFDDLLAATRPYRELWRGLRKVAKVTRKNGAFEHTFTGPRGHITVESVEADDGSITITVSGASKDAAEDADRKIMVGTVNADGLAGHWDIYNKEGEAVRTIDWTRTAAGDVSSTWHNTKNGKTATYTRTGTTAEFTITKDNGAKLDVTWDTATHAGNASYVNGAGRTGEKCWDTNLCNVDCAQ